MSADEGTRSDDGGNDVGVDGAGVVESSGGVGGAVGTAVEGGSTCGVGSRVLSRARPTPQPRVELCPYCGRESMNTTRCEGCGGKFDALSRQATQNAMGPWWVRDAERPFRPGCSYETIRAMVGQGKIERSTVVRGPTTRQFWRLAGRTAGVAHLLGVCHACQRGVSPEAFMCQACGASFTTETDRQHLGLASVSLLPGHAAPERIAAVSVPTGVGVGNAAGGRVEVGAVGSVEAGPMAGWARAGAVRGVGLRGDPMTDHLAAVRALDGLGGGAVGAAGGGEGGAHAASGQRHRHHRHGPSPVAAVAFFVLGVVLTACGVGAALITAQGGVEEALGAMGLGRGAQRVASGGGDGGLDAGEGTVTQGGSGAGADGGVAAGSSVAGASSGEVGDEATGSVESVNATVDATPTAALTEEQRRAARRGETLAGVVELLGTGDAADLRECLRVLERAGREGVLEPEEASAWRGAIEARLARGAMAELP